jgi:hypothetical protein
LSDRLQRTDLYYYRWCQEYGGLKTDQARRMKDLERGADDEQALTEGIIELGV